MLNLSNLKKSFFSIILISLLIPLVMGILYYYTLYKSNTLDEFHKNQKNNAEVLADIVSTHLWFYDMDGIKELLDKYKKESDIQRLIVYEDKNTPLIVVEKDKICKQANSFFTLPIYMEQKGFKRKEIGYLRYEYTTCLINKTVNKQSNIILFINFVQFLLAILLLSWLFNIKIIKPANILIKQSKLNDTAKLFNNLSHQWRQPLAELSNYLIHIRTLLLIKKEWNINKIDKLINDSEKLIEHLSNTITTFRNFYSNNSQKEYFFVSSVIENVNFLVHNTLKYNNIKLEIELDESLKVLGYKEDLIHALVNIITNSIEIFKERDISNPNIKIKAYKDGKYINISLEDNGGGVHVKPIDKIFELHESTKNYGSGLGLYMVKELLLNMKATITAKNTISGTIVTIKILNIN